MEQYIPKSALVAEIERLKQEARELYGCSQFDTAYKNVLKSINTLEVKEVDLGKEIDREIETRWRGEYLFETKFRESAKHFFELGLKARIDKELVEEVYSHIDNIKDTADRMTSGNFMHNRAAIKFSANTIAKVLELIGF